MTPGVNEPFRPAEGDLEPGRPVAPSDLSPGVPFELKSPADSKVTSHRVEPARQPIGIGGSSYLRWGLVSPPPIRSLVDLLQRRCLNCVETASALGSDTGEAVLPQHPQVLGDSWLTDPELRLNDGDDLSRRVLLIQQHFQDPTADRIAEDIEGLHETYVIRARLYSATLMKCLLADAFLGRAGEFGR